MGLSLGLEKTMREWGWEVDDEAERLIKRGIAPWEAIEQARKNISRRRARKADECDAAKQSQGCGFHDPLG